jgi:hypothetical protein
VTEIGAAELAQLGRGRAGQGFRDSARSQPGGNVPIELLAACENRAKNADRQGFRRAVLMHIYRKVLLETVSCGQEGESWRGDWTRNYNASPELEGWFECNSARWL